MKVLFAYPPLKNVSRSGRWPSAAENQNINFLYPPWFLAYSAALLEKENMEVGLIDSAAEEMDEEEFMKYIEKKSPELLVIETSTIAINRDLLLMKKIKDQFGCKIALAGPHATALTSEIMAGNPFIDFILIGEYELTALELAQKLKFESKHDGILGLAYRTNGTVKINQRRPLIKDLDSLPLPARHLLRMDKYNEAFAKFPNQQMVSSRGCPFQCVFCLWPQTLFGRFVRYRSPEKIVDEMQLLWNEYKPKEIYFDDDTFTANQQQVLNICKEIKSRGLDLKWSVMGHANLKEEVVKEMVSAGLSGVKFGVETASPEVQKAIKKHLNLENVKHFVNLAKKYNLRTHATYMIGLPSETRETVKKTLEMAVTLGTDSFQISIATPFPGTEFYNWAKQNGYLVTEDFDRFNGNKEAVVSYPNLTKEEIDRFFNESLNLTSKFDVNLINAYLKLEYQKCGMKGVVKFMAKEGPMYAKRLLKKKMFTAKSLLHG